ncbi:FANCB protein, partial [Tricholaema leucomelas]|nr:FANCB protein [Tricholaema leucomelas]
MPQSEQEQFLSYNGEVLIFQLSQPKHVEGAADKTVDLCVRRMIFNRDTEVFVQKSSGVFSMHGSPLKMEIICCSCTTDSRTGIILPCILLKRKKRNNFVKYLLLLLHSSNQFEQSFQFKLDYELKEDIRLFAGPSVLWRHAHNLFYISSSTCTVLSAPVQLSSVVWTGEIRDEGPVVLGIRTACLTESEAETVFSTSDQAIWGSELFGYAVKARKMLPGTCFMPHAYGRVVSSVCVCKSEVLRKQLRTSLVAITRKNHLIWFQGGLPRGICELPYEKPYSVNTAVTSSNDLLFIVSFAFGNVCVVQRRGSLQVASKWQKVKSVLVDDFIGSGSEQLLLLFKDGSNPDVLSTFTITDLGAVSYASGNPYKHNVSAAEGLQENGLLTVRALETRLQVGCTAVRELQQHLALQKRVILQSCKALRDLVEGRTHVLPTAKEEGLVPLWDEVEDPPRSVGQERPLAHQVQEHLVENLWQRVVGDNLVVGVQLAATFHLSLSDASLSLVVDQDFSLTAPIIKCQNKVSKLNKAFSALPVSPCQMEPPTKKMKLDLCSSSDLKNQFPKGCSGAELDGGRSVTAVTSLSPLLAFHRVHCVVLLHAKRQEPQSDSLQQSKKIAVICGKISLSLEDISSGKHSVKMLRDNGYCTGSMEDILAVLAVAARFSFHVVSAACTLTPVSSWLLREMECMPFKECKANVFCHKAGNMYGTIINWTLKNPLEGILTLFCRNLTVLFQCLHSLRRILPASCEIKLLRSASRQALAEQLALALEKEMLTSRSSFFSTLTSGSSFFSKESKADSTFTWGSTHDRKVSSAAVASLLESEGGVEQFRKKVQSEQDKGVLSMAQTMTAALYQEVTWKITESQLSSDMIVWRLS